MTITCIPPTIISKFIKARIVGIIQIADQYIYLIVAQRKPKYPTITPFTTTARTYCISCKTPLPYTIDVPQYLFAVDSRGTAIDPTHCNIDLRMIFHTILCPACEVKRLRTTCAELFCHTCSKRTSWLTPQTPVKGFHIFAGKTYHTQECPDCTGAQSDVIELKKYLEDVNETHLG